MASILAWLCFGCARSPKSDPAYVAEIDAWHKRRVERLLSPTGWVTLVGLHWLDEGPNRVGSAPDNDIVLPKNAPARIGTLHRAGDKVRAELDPALGLAGGELASDAASEPTVITLGSISFFVIQRGERIGLRVRDAEHPARKSFKGIERYPVDAGWRVQARFEPYDPPRTIQVPSVLGGATAEECPGALVFEKDGATYRLDPILEVGSDELFLIFGDRTNGKETYGAGRFVYAPMPKDGRTVIDFNRAYNPPCAFTPFATCPLPPSQNRLAARVEAGEKAYGDH